MKELFGLILRFDLKNLLVKPASNVVIQVFRSLFVAVFALIADAGVLWIISLTGLHYLICAVFGFLVGVFVNYILSEKFVFIEKPPINRAGVIAVYIIIGVAGLGLTLVFMWFFTEIAGLHFMLSRVVAAILTFAWNFGSRKLLLYRKR